MSFLNSLVNGLSLGSIYAIIALGYTMVYGIAKMLNFAHGDVIMIGSYIIYVLSVSYGLNPVISLIISAALSMALGIFIEKIAYKPLRGASSKLAVLITAIGVSYLLQNTALLIFGSNPKSFTNIIGWEGISLADGNLKIQGITLVTIITSMVILLALQIFIKKTRQGQAMLAVAEDNSAATLMGISVNGTIALTFAIGSMLAAVAGALMCSAYPSLTPYTGAMPWIKAFVAAVLGGIGSIPGAMVGGLVLGIVEILSRSYISSQLADAIVFGILILVLLLKPTGIFGKTVQEKV